MSQKSRMMPFHFESFLTHQKKRSRMLRDEAEKNDEYAKKVEENERRQVQTIVQTFLDDHSQLSESDLYLVRIPSGLTELAPPSNERTKRYSEHVSQIIHDATESMNNSTVANLHDDDAKDRLRLVEQKISQIPKLHAIADRLCGMCKGGCCAAGHDHAYLSVSTIKQFMKSQPELSTAEIHEHYLSRVGTKTVVDACINQTEIGCSLPRNMRSDICNGFYCEP